MLCYCCTVLCGLVDVVLYSVLFGSRQDSCHSSFVAARPRLALRGYQALNQTNDGLIIMRRTVCANLFAPVSINLRVHAEPQPNLIVHCMPILMCSEVNVKASLHTNENIFMHPCSSAYEYIHKKMYPNRNVPNGRHDTLITFCL